MVTSLDLVAEQLRGRGGRAAVVHAGRRSSGAATRSRCRINAEDPATGFLPSPGTITRLRLPGGPGVRWDGGYDEGDTVSQHYDNLVGKLVVWAPDRERGAARACCARSRELEVDGIATTIPAHARAARPPRLRGRPRTPPSGSRTRSTSPLFAAPDAGAGRCRRPTARAERRARRADRAGRGRRQALLGAAVAARRARRRRTRAPRAAPRPRPGRRRRRRRGGNGTITAPMQGTIVKVLVAEGDTVEAGQARARARGDEDGEPHQRRDVGHGRARSACSEGDTVGTGDVLVVIE